MVRVLANGEIVPDDDPRAAQSAQQRSNSASGRRETGGSNVHSTAPPQADAAYQAGGQTVSVFDSLNQRLAALGVPSWNAGPYVVDPIVSVGFLLALLFMGVQGLVFAAILFFVVNYSGMGRGGGAGGGGGGGRGGGGRGGMGGVGGGGGPRPPGGGGGGGGAGPRGGGVFSGAGHRLGQL